MELSMNIRIRHSKYDKVAWVYVLPLIILSTLLLYYCIFFTVYSSFTDWNGISSEMNFIGLENYIKLFKDPYFYVALKNNLLFFFFTVFIQAAVGLLVASLLKYKLPFSNVYKAIFFLPIAMATAIITAIFRIILDPNMGSLNTMFHAVGLDFLAQAWLGDKRFALMSIISVNIFQWMGFSMIFYYAALMSLPEDVYESAKLDGAGFWRTLFSITIPMLKGTTSVLIILGIVGSLKTFDIVKLLTNSGPGRATLFLNTYLYEKAFTSFDAGSAAAIGVCILVLAISMSVIQLKLGKED